jgi:phosphoserine phosphatase
MLLTVGNPVAVQPDITLFRHARKSRWPIVDWSTAGSVSRTLAPAGGGG